MTAAVQSVEDHGYVMDIGILNARSFLTKIPDQELAVGQIVSVCVTGCQIDGHVATLTLSTVESVKFKGIRRSGQRHSGQRHSGL